MKLPLSKQVLGAGLCIVALWVLGARSGCSAAANGDIVHDTFTGNIAPPTAWKSGAAGLQGREPDSANLPKSSWIGQGSSILKNVAWLGADNSIKIALPAESNNYRKPTSFTISVELNTATISPIDSQNYYRGMGLGFWDAGGTRFYGIVLHKDGSITASNGHEVGKTTSAISTKLVGDASLFDSEAWYRLSYDVDTAKSTIANIKLTDIVSGRVTDYTFPPDAGVKPELSATNTAMAGVYVNSSIGGNYGYFDNFRVY